MTTTRDTRYVVYERDADGVPFSIEVVEADTWDPSVLEAPAPERADARLVRLRGGMPPPAREWPRWLRVEAAPRRAAEGRAAYAVEGGTSTDGGALDAWTRRIAEVGRSLWPWSPYYRTPGATLDEYLLAGAAALGHPRPAPTERDRRLETLVGFCEGRDAPFGALASARGEVLERLLAQSFGDPDAFADALLLERIEELDADVARELGFLRAAEVPADAQAYVELAIDRRVLLAQASPWRFVEGEPFAAPLAAVRAWRQRYERAYAAHYRSAVAARTEVRRELAEAGRLAAALERLNRISRLGPRVGERAIIEYRAALEAVESLPAEPEAGAPRTAGVVIGRDPRVFLEAPAVAAALRAAFDEQRRRLSSATVRMILSRQGVPALDRLLQAITASDLESLDRVLDEALTAHIDALLGEVAPPPLEALAERFPEVTAENLDEVVGVLRAILEAAISEQPEGPVTLR